MAAPEPRRDTRYICHIAPAGTPYNNLQFEGGRPGEWQWVATYVDNGARTEIGAGHAKTEAKAAKRAERACADHKQRPCRQPGQAREWSPCL